MFLLPTEDLRDVESSLGSLIEKFQNKTIFLSGATGFIGKCLVESLVWLNRSQKLNLSIHSISRDPEFFFNQYPHFRNYSEFKLYFGNVCDKEIPFFGAQIDFLIHAATDVANESASRDIFNNCIKGTNNILNLAANFNCKHFLLLSSGAVYGTQPEELSDLSEVFQGSVSLSSSGSSYALGKQCSEWLVQQASHEMEVKIARCFAFVGPYLPLDKHFAIGNFLYDAISGRDIKILGDGSALRTYLYTSDLVIWLIKILLVGRNSGVWNVGGSKVISILDLALLTSKLIDPNLDVKVYKSLSGNRQRYIPNIRKVEIEMGLIPKVSLNQAIQKTAKWNRVHGKKQL